MVTRARGIVSLNAVPPHAWVSRPVPAEPYMMSDVHLRGAFQCFGKLKWVNVNDIRWSYGLGVP